MLTKKEIPGNLNYYVSVHEYTQAMESVRSPEVYGPLLVLYNIRLDLLVGQKNITFLFHYFSITSTTMFPNKTIRFQIWLRAVFLVVFMHIE